MKQFLCIFSHLEPTQKSGEGLELGRNGPDWSRMGQKVRERTYYVSSSFLRSVFRSSPSISEALDLFPPTLINTRLIYSFSSLSTV